MSKKQHPDQTLASMPSPPERYEMENGLSLSAVLALALTILILGISMRIAPRLFLPALESGASKIATLDGLRGIVALSVVMHHAIIRHLNFSGAAVGLGAPTNNFQNQLGSASVSIFFMISAYLFCGGLIRNKGKLNLLAFVEGRVFRIVPLYVVLVCLTVLFAFCMTGMHILVPPENLLKSIARISLFGFVDYYEVNTVDVSLLVGQIWTFRFEWILYSLLPALAFSMRRTNSIWPLFAGLSACALYNQLFAFFVAGAAASILVGADGLKARVVWQVAGLAGLMMVVFGYHDSRGWPQAVLLTPFLVAVLQGHRWFAILGSRPLKLLGDISFSIYLLHGFALWTVFHLIAGTNPYRVHGVVSTTGLMLLAGMLAVIFGFAGYFLVERRWMKLRPISGFRPISPQMAG